MKKELSIVLILSLSVLTLHAGTIQNSPGDKTRPDSIVYKQTPEGELKLFFHYPNDWTKNDLRPLIVFFFGGGWAGGNVNQFLVQAEYLAKRGMVTVLADYRVLNRHGTLPDKCVEDGKSAVRWLRKNAGILGVNPDRIVASGGSAGGHVAICTEVIDGLEAEGEDLTISSKPNLLVLFNPVLNTKVDRVPSHLGTTEMALQISPNHHLDESVPPIIMFFGLDDRLIEYAYTYTKLAKKLDLKVQLWIAEGQVHAFFNKPPWKESTLFLTDRFLVEKGYLQGEPVIEMPKEGKMELYLPGR